MNDAYILIENGGVVFSDKLLQSFPEITATVTGNVIRVENVWREDLISIIGDNVFWTEEQAFASFSIIFTNNKASVDTLSNLLVRYVNFHDEDFEITLPAYGNNIATLYDPLGLGVRPNYFGALEDYVDGLKTISELSDVVYEMYLIILPKYDDSVGDAVTIATILGSIDILDITKFLSSNLMALPILNTVDGSSELGTSGTKKYILQTATKDFEFIEDNGFIDINRFCVFNEDDTIIKQKILSTSTETTQCFLKTITGQEFSDSNIVKISTYFGAFAEFKTDYQNKKYLSIGVSKFGVNYTYLANLIIDILRISKQKQLDKIYVSAGDTSFNFSFSDKYVVFSYDYKSAPLLSVVKEALDTEISVLSNSGYTNDFVQDIKIGQINGVGVVLPENLTLDMVSVSCDDGVKEQFYNSQNINLIYVNGKVIYSDGVFTIRGMNDLSFMGTPIETKITNIHLVLDEYDLTTFPATVRETSKDFYYGVINSSTGLFVPSYGVVNNVGTDFDKIYNSKVVLECIDNGIKTIDALTNTVLLDVSASHKEVVVKNIHNSYMLLCSFGDELNKNDSFFVSDYGSMYPNPYGTEYLDSMSKIYLNGVALTDYVNVAKILISTQPLSISSDYSVRIADIDFIANLMSTLRNGYLTKFRYSENNSNIGYDEDEYAYNLLLEICTDLFKDFSGYSKLVSLANGSSIDYTMPYSDIIDMNQTYFSMTQTIFSIQTTNVHRNDRELSFGVSGDARGYFDMLSTSNDEIVYEYGNLEQTLTEIDESLVASINDYVFVNHTKVGDDLTLYFAQFTGTIGNTYITPIAISINTKAMVATREIGDTTLVVRPVASPAWNGDVISTTRGANAIRDMYVIYTPTANADGSVTVSYQALDKDGNDITDQFNTITLGDTYTHKDLDDGSTHTRDFGEYRTVWDDASQEISIIPRYPNSSVTPYFGLGDSSMRLNLSDLPTQLVLQITGDTTKEGITPTSPFGAKRWFGMPSNINNVPINLTMYGGGIRTIQMPQAGGGSVKQVTATDIIQNGYGSGKIYASLRVER